MNRRGFLALLGTVGFAGCSDRTPDDTPTPRAGTVVETPSPAATPTGTASPTSSPTTSESPTPTDTPSPTSTPTDTPTDTPTQAELRAANRLDRAGRIVNRISKEYARQGDGTELTAVTAATTEFYPNPLVDPISDLSDLLLKIEPQTDEQEKRLDGFEATRVFLQRATRCQAALVAVFEHLRVATRNANNERRNEARRAFKDADEDRNEAQRHLSTIREETSADRIENAGGITRTEYSDKVDQFVAEEHSASVLVSAGLDFTGGLGTLEDARRKFDNDRFDDAEELAERAADTFEGVIDGIASAEIVTAFTGSAEKLESKAEDLREEADAIAAQAADES